MLPIFKSYFAKAVALEPWETFIRFLAGPARINSAVFCAPLTHLPAPQHARTENAQETLPRCMFTTTTPIMVAGRYSASLELCGSILARSIRVKRQSLGKTARQSVDLNSKDASLPVGVSRRVVDGSSMV